MISKVKLPMEKFRDFLDKNRIFFEVFAWIVVPIALGIMSYFVSRSAVRISEYQAEVAYRQNLPQIRVKMELAYNPELRRYDQESLEIYNDGFRLQNFSVKKIVVVHATRQEGRQIDQLYIPIIFYPINFSTGNLTGLLITLTSPKNHEKWIKIDTDLSAVSRGPVIYNARLLRIPAVTYKDYFGNQHNEYFLVLGSVSAHKLPAELGKAWVQYFEQHRASLLLDIDRLSAKEIIELFDSAPPALRWAPPLPSQ